jgi:hypothetical protein
MRTNFDSASTGVRQGNVAGFPAIWTVIESVTAHAHIVLAFADGAIFFAGAMLLRFVAHHAKNGTGHGSLQGKLYLSMATRGKARLRAVVSTIYSLSQFVRRFFHCVGAKF